MKPIEIEVVQEWLNSFINKEVYVHVETTNGAYSSHYGGEAFNVGVYVRNAKVSFNQAKVVQADGRSFRIGLKLDFGWIYVEGLTDCEIYKETKFLLAGLDEVGRLMVALQISETPFGE